MDITNDDKASTDWLAVDQNNKVLSRGSSEESVRRAMKTYPVPPGMMLTYVSIREYLRQGGAEDFKGGPAGDIADPVEPSEPKKAAAPKKATAPKKAPIKK